MKTLSMSASQMIKRSYADLLNTQVLLSTPNLISKPLDGYDKPDGLQSWVVLFAAVYLVMVGLIPTTSVGVLYVELSELYGKPQIISWMCSIQASLLCISGPVAAIVCQKLGARIACLIGTIGITVCLVVTANLDSLPATFVIFGVLLGFLTAVIYIPAITFPNRYFMKRKVLAMSIAIALGGGPAFIVFPYLIRVVEAHYGWRASLYFLAACSAQGVVASMLLREPRFNPINGDSYKNEENLIDGQTTFSSRHNMTMFHKSSPYLHHNGIDQRRGSIESHDSHDFLDNCEHVFKKNELPIENELVKEDVNVQQCLETIVENKPWIPTQSNIDSRSRSNTVESAKPLARSWRNLDDKMSVDCTSCSSIVNGQETTKTMKCSCCAPSNTKLGIFIAGMFCWGWGAGIFQVLFNDYALQNGHSEENISTMYLLMGVGSLAFRTLFCLLGGIAPNFNKFIASSIVYLLQGLSIMAFLLFNNAYVYMIAVLVYTGMYGWSAGLLGVTILALNLEAYLEAAVAGSWLAYGIGYILTSPFSVFMAQYFDYEVAFGQAVASYFLAAILSTSVYIWDRYNSCRKTLKSNDAESL